MQKAGGIELGYDYPYTSGKGKTGTCKLPNGYKFNATITGYNAISKTRLSEGKMVTQIAKSPMSVCVDAQKWQTYKKVTFDKR